MAAIQNSRLYSDGILRDPAAEFKVIGPWTGEVIAYAADASKQDMEVAISAARRAFDETEWSRDAKLRRDNVVRFGEALQSKRNRLAELAHHEVGAAMGTVAGQIDRPLAAIQTFLKIFDEFEWQTDMGVATSRNIPCRRFILHEPIGVTGAITPWNSPFSISIGKVIPALLAGCTVVLKPAPETPLIGAILGEAAHDACLPHGTFNVLTSKHPAMLGEMLVTDKRVDLVSFTGSTPVGKRIMELGASTLKRLFLELGGKSAQIIFADAPNFAEAVAKSQLIACSHAGQGCAIYSRLLVERSRYAEAVEILRASYEAFAKKWGNPEDPTCIMGPVISDRQRQRVLSYIESGKTEGARLIAGGKTATDRGGGFFIEPTCFVDVNMNMRIAREEIFGPVLVVLPFDDEADAIRIANDTDYGLSGGVHSGDPDRAMRVAQRVRSGTFGINDGVWSAPDMPFGGNKQSGIGREWGLEGFKQFLQTKSVGIKI